MTTSGFDAEELLHLGLHASNENDPHEAIDCLKQCLQLEPDNAKAVYMLGALYAEIGLYDRAKQTLTRAVELNSSEYTAVFQLGLLHLSSGDAALAATVWNHLDPLDPDHYLNLFRHGLLALANDQFVDCVELLDRGIAANTFNDALNNDMRNLRVSAEAGLAASPKPAEVNGVPEGSTLEHHLPAGYRQRKNH